MRVWYFLLAIVVPTESFVAFCLIMGLGMKLSGEEEDIAEEVWNEEEVQRGEELRSQEVYDEQNNVKYAREEE